MPAAAKAHTPAGAEAFVRYFWQQVDRAWSTPDASLISPLCQPSSEACKALQTDAEELVAKHEHYASASAEWDTIRALDDASSVARVELIGYQLAANVVNASGQVIQTMPRQPEHFVYGLRWTSSGWRVETGKAAA